jgi:hypothetical protein
VESSVLWLIGAERLVGKVGEDEGDGLALRNEGNEILFAPYESKPMKWVPVTEFVVLEPDPDGESHIELPEETTAGEEAQPETPFARRRRE